MKTCTVCRAESTKEWCIDIKFSDCDGNAADLNLKLCYTCAGIWRGLFEGFPCMVIANQLIQRNSESEAVQ